MDQKKVDQIFDVLIQTTLISYLTHEKMEFSFTDSISTGKQMRVENL
jgi:hypothetical protein